MTDTPTSAPARPHRLNLALLVALGCFAWEFWYTRDRDRLKCFRAFLHNHWAGLAIFVGIVLDYGVR